MEWFKVWIIGICGVSIAVSAIRAVTPGNSAGKSIQLVGALALILAVIAPLRKIKAQDISFFNSRYQIQYSERSDSFHEENEKLCNTIIEEKLEAYILQRADEIGAECENVSVTVRRNHGEYYPYDVKVAGRKLSSDKCIELSDIIRQEFGIDKVKVTGG